MIDVDCDKAGYPQNGGNKMCTVFIGIECPGSVCAYKIYLEL